MGFVHLLKQYAEKSLKGIDWMEQPSDKTSQEQARESLIAISYTLSEEEDFPLSSSIDVKPVIINSTNGYTTKRGNSDAAAEKFRSELISISYDESPSPSPSPDVVVAAVSPTLPNGISHG